MAARAITFLFAVLAALAFAAPVHAAFPGNNGKIAFTREDAGEEGVSVHTVNPDGSGLSGGIGTFFYSPAWSPDGLTFAYDDQYIIYIGLGQTPEEDLAIDAAWSPDGTKIAYQTFDGITIANANGSGRTALGVPGARPAWSPDGTRIAFDAANDVRVVDVDGSNATQLTNAPGFDGAPNWSPDGSRIAFASIRDGNFEVYVMNPDGSGQTRLTNTAMNESSPAWSPDGTKIAWSTGNPSAIWYMNADGTGATQVTHPQPNNQDDFDPDWQPLPVNTPSAFPRPRGATPIYASLVPAFAPCASPNITHGAPLSFGSCGPPTRQSSNLTVGAPDANGRRANSLGFIQLRVHAGTPGGADDSDVLIDLQVTSVYKAPDLSDYGGELASRTSIRRTDEEGGVSSTTIDFPLSFAIPCTPTADPDSGANCAVNTSADAIRPGIAPEGRRSNWALSQAQVYDGGSDGLASTTGDNTLFLTQGIFIP